VPSYASTVIFTLFADCSCRSRERAPWTDVASGIPAVMV